MFHVIFPVKFTQLCQTLCNLMDYTVHVYRLYSPWNSQGHNTGLGSLSLLQGIFPTQRLSPSLPHCRRILNYCAAVRCLVAQSCLTLCDPMDCSPPGSSVHGILQARNWNGLPFPSPGHLPNSGIKPSSPALQVNSLPSESPGKPKKTGVGNLSPLQGIFSTQE